MEKIEIFLPLEAHESQANFLKTKTKSTCDCEPL